MPEFSRGQSVEVVDVTAPRSPKKLPFARGATVTVAETRPGHVRLKEYGGWWKAHRFQASPHG